jgi:site-specific DNA-methyltransferase (adenine-specific)
MNTEVMTSSKTTEWTTPYDLIEHLDSIYHFTLDPAATKENALCEKFYDAVTNGLAYSWAGETVFVNPPYGRQHNKKWAQKIAEEGRHTTVVALIASRTGSKWFQDNIVHANKLYFLRGRLKFGGCASSSAPFDSVVAVWDGSGEKKIEFCEWRDIK